MAPGKKSEAKIDYFEAITAMQLLLQIVGMPKYSVKTSGENQVLTYSKNDKIISFVVILLTRSAFVLSMSYCIILPIDDVVSLLYAVCDISKLIAPLVIVLLQYYHKDTFLCILGTIYDIDQELKVNKLINSQLNYKDLQKRIRMHHAMGYCTIILLVLSDVLYFWDDKIHVHDYFWLGTFYGDHLLNMAILWQMFAILYEIRLRFVQMNQLLLDGSSTFNGNAKRTFKIFANCYVKLCMSTKQMSLINGIMILIKLGSFFVYICYMINEMLLVYQDYGIKYTNSILCGVIFWIFFEIGEVLPIIYYFTKITTEGYKFQTSSEVFLKAHLTKTEFFKEMKWVNIQLSIISKELEFSVCELFPLQWSLIKGILGSILTYLIIIWQFQLKAMEHQTRSRKENNY